MLSEDVLKMCYRFHKLKHLPLLNLLHFKDVFQRDLVEVLPHMIHLVICLRKHNITEQNIFLCVLVFGGFCLYLLFRLNSFKL